MNSAQGQDETEEDYQDMIEGGDDWFDLCTNCGDDDFVLDNTAWERICRNCGAVSCYEFSIPNNQFKTPTYSKCTYFNTTILQKVLLRGATIDSHLCDIIVKKYGVVVTRFKETRAIHKRKNFPHSEFVLFKICEELKLCGILPYIRLPKLISTRERLEDDWKVISPF